MTPRSLGPFIREYGNSARIELRTGDLTEIILDEGVADEEVSAFASRATSGGPYDAVVTVAKTQLAQRLVGPTPQRVVRLFLFAGALRRALSRGITRFEAEVWPEAPAPLVIAVADTDVELTGPYFAILGGTFLPAVTAAAAVPVADPGFSPISAARDRQVGWDTQWVRGLTPWHFELSGSCADEQLQGLLRAQLVKLVVLFTCDRARAQPTPVPPMTVRAEYRGREHLAVIPIDERLPIDTTDAETTAVLRAVDWCYRRAGIGTEPDWVSDRLPFVQTRIAQTLEPHPEQDRLTAFVRAMPYLLEGIEWQWKAFIEGKVGEYLTQVEQVESVVADTATSFADRSAALAKALTDTILAAVAVLIGSFIAAAFKDPFNGTLFRISVRTYAVYVVLFPGLLGLLASHHSLQVARSGFDARVARFKETLYTGKVEEIVGQRVIEAQATFYRWLRSVAAIYLVVAVAAWVAADVFPDQVRRDPATSQAPITITVPSSVPSSGGAPSGTGSTPPTSR